MKTESTQELEQRRNTMIFALENSPDALDSIVYKLAITGINKQLNSRVWKRNVAIGLIVGVIVCGSIIALCSCQTVSAMGRDITNISESLRK